MATVAAALLVMGAAVQAPAASAERKTLVVASGEVTGTYYPAAGALCRVVNKERPHGMSCAVTPSMGSAANVEALRSGDADFAILQSRAAQLAVSGSEGFKAAGPFPDLRAVMSLHGESVAVVARQAAEIKSLADLKGKRVNVGRTGSFQRAMAEYTLEAAGLSEGDFAASVELDLAEVASELCEGNIDAAFVSGIHPMAEVEAAIEGCDAQLVPVKAKPMEVNLRRMGWLSPATLGKGTYDGIDGDLATLQLKAVLVATTRLAPDDVHDLLKAVHANFGAFTRLHPVLKGLGKAATARDGIAIKLHDGADRFYGETRLK
ncbi:TAXI family TRAP transporter solute-binding subunit [Magnetospirillum sp. UT-4]|uniref:TAXI family TRAP transporter solute-binding subunit n=1 Tax=Magnetospirillum sp. UT-4 TaxID=2681467 RepID=UPI0020C51BD8|nr:TAXI family TRAP transporter solute-binding subunit [Magnetospirillum sp. UT-4]